MVFRNSICTCAVAFFDRITIARNLTPAIGERLERCAIEVQLCFHPESGSESVGGLPGVCVVRWANGGGGAGCYSDLRRGLGAMMNKTDG